MLCLAVLVGYICAVNSKSIFDTATPIPGIPEDVPYLGETRRIIRGNAVADTRPYMVYLRAANKKTSPQDNWLCGGVIIHELYVLTSAACIEDVGRFYVISGTHKWVALSTTDNSCINYGAKKAVWKCVPKSYVFDGHEYDNIKWMVNDIAVVKVDEAFNFQKKIKGCDFIPAKVAFNNRSLDLEKPDTVASIAGWGSDNKFSELASRSTTNSPELMETDVLLISKQNCKKRWAERYHQIIDQYMICAKDGSESAMSGLCLRDEVNCKELVYSSEYKDKEETRRVLRPDRLGIHTSYQANHLNKTRRSKIPIGGFCENDHGGPLIVGQGKTATVIGVISACMTRELTNECYGPYLYTSVYNNKNLIYCAIDKDIKATCRKLLRTQTTETLYHWNSNDKNVDKTVLRYNSGENDGPGGDNWKNSYKDSDRAVNWSLPPNPSSKLSVHISVKKERHRHRKT